MRKIIGIFFITTLLISCSTESSDKEKANLQVLDSLKSKCDELVYSPDLLETATKLKDEALRQKNDMYTGHGYKSMLYYYLNNVFTNSENMNDTIRYYGQKSSEYFGKAGENLLPLQIEVNILRWEIYFTDGEGIMLRIFDLLNETEKTEDNRLKADAFSLLGTGYLLFNNAKEARDAFQKELEFIRKTDIEDTNIKNHRYINIFDNLGEISLSMEDFDAILTYCDSMKLYLERCSETERSQKRRNKIDLLSVKSYTEMGKPETATPFVERLLLYCNTVEENNQKENYHNILLALAPYYCEKKEYDKALNLVNKVIDYYTVVSSHNVNLISAKTKKADILSASGKDLREALNLRKEVQEYTSDIARKDATRQLNEMYTLHEVNKLEKKAVEQESKTQHFQMISTVFIIACICMIVIVVIIKLNYNKLRKKNERLFEQYKDMDKYKAQISKLNSSIAQKTSEIREESLFEKIENYITESKCYKEIEISREFLASEIGTNREYMTRAIQENVGMTFTEYINHHRLEYARKLLIGNTDLSVEYIYIDAGFNTKSTFYRLFKQKYDLTPKELRSIAIENPD